MRIIVMCGKGGVGKSTLAGALGLKAAKSGLRTLLYSVDPADSLGVMFEQKVTAEPTQLATNLKAVELDPVAELEATWGDARAYAEDLMRTQGMEQKIGPEIATLPGVHEFAALAKLKQYADSGQFDLIILDNAPTGFALRMLSLPELFNWYAQHGVKLYERHGPSIMMALPLLGGNIPMPPGAMIERALGLVQHLRGLPELLQDPAVTSARVVLTPDILSLDEARDLYTALSLYGISTDAVMLNRFLPDAVQDPFFAAQRTREQALRASLGAEFAPLPILEIPYRSEAPIGEAALAALGDAIWPSGDPSVRMAQEQALVIRTEGEKILVDIRLPFVDPKAVDLAKFENELYITIGQHRRNLLLPPEAGDMQPVKAKFSEGRLLVTLSR